MIWVKERDEMWRDGWKRTMRLLSGSVNQRLRSGPTASARLNAGLGSGNSEITWVLMLSRANAPCSMNQMLWSGPLVIAPTWLVEVEGVNSSMAVVIGSIRPMRCEPPSVNHSAPSAPAVMPKVPRTSDGSVNSVTTWVVGLMRPSLLAKPSVNQMFPSGPEVMA